MPSSTESIVYFLTIFEFDVGGSQKVRLYGAIKAEKEDTKEEFSFVLADKMQFDPKLLPAGEITQSVSNPFGMTGVELSQFEAEGSIYKDANKNSVTDFRLSATARFPAIPNLQLIGALVAHNSNPCLAIVILDVVNPQGQPQAAITLTQFVQAIIGGSWFWGDSVTNKFAFQSGHMYYLTGKDNFTFNYTEGGAGKSLVCSPGYHLSAVLQIFQKYNFEVDLDVTTENEITLTGTYLGEIDFDFVQLTKLTLQIATLDEDTHFRIGTTAIVLGTSFDISADYANSTFTGSVTVDDIGLTVVFTWTQGSNGGSGFAIIQINGLPLKDLDLIEKYLEVLNKLRGSGCEQIVGDWLNNLVTTTITPGLNGKPTKDGSGNMNLPLKLSYDIKTSLGSVASGDIPFTVNIVPPRSLRGLPDAMWDNIQNAPGNLVNITTQILSNKDTYIAITEIAIQRGGGKALARFICRALEWLEDALDELKDIAENFVCETLAEAAELAGALMGIALAGVAGIVMNFLEELWDSIKKLFGGGDSDKEKAERQIQNVWNNIKQVVDKVDARVSDIKNTIKLQALTTTLNQQEQFTATVTWQLGIDKVLDPGSSLTCGFKFLPGAPGSQQQQALKDNPFFPVVNNTLVKNWSDIPDNAHYQMNGAAQSVLSGFTFMNSNTEQSMTDAINQLGEAADHSDVAAGFRDYLQQKLSEFQGYNRNGISSDWVYTQSDSRLIIGSSRIGVNTRITN
jgi:hypothetical protein